MTMRFFPERECSCSTLLKPKDIWKVNANGYVNDFIGNCLDDGCYEDTLRKNSLIYDLFDKVSNISQPRMLCMTCNSHDHADGIVKMIYSRATKLDNLTISSYKSKNHHVVIIKNTIKPT